MSFGPLDSTLTGPLFATDAMRACFSDAARLQAMLDTEAALARAEASLGLAPAALAEAIDAITGLDPTAIGATTALAGVPTIPFVSAVQARLPPELERAFHKGATTQDIMDTALVLCARPALDLIAADLDAVLAGLARLAEAHRADPCAGRTYGQHAAPITFGFKAAIWMTGIADAALRLPSVRDRLLVVSLGGPVGTLAGLGAHGPAVLEAMAATLGLRTPPLAWHTLRGRMAEAGGWLQELAGALAKLATDVAHLCSTEVAEVSEPYVPGRGGSSAMPHKRNPVSCTIILAAHGAAKGYAAPLADAMAAAHERPAGAWHAEWHALPALFGVVSGALREAAALANGLVVDPARMRTNLDATHGLLFADAAAARLGTTLGREAAHKRVEHAATSVRNGAGNLRDVLADDPALPDVSAAFDLEPSIAAAQPWIDRALAHARTARAALAAARS